MTSGEKGMPKDTVGKIIYITVTICGVATILTVAACIIVSAIKLTLRLF